VLFSNASIPLVACSADTLTVPTNRIDNLYVGSVIAGDMQAAGVSAASASCGLLARKVVGINPGANGNTVLSTQPATLLDIVLEAHVGAAEAMAVTLGNSSSDFKDGLLLRRRRDVTEIGKFDMKIPNSIIPWDTKASIQADVQIKPIMDLSVSGGLSFDIVHPPGWTSAAILALSAADRLQRVVVAAEVAITIGLDFNVKLTGAVEIKKKFDFTESLPALPLAPFPCLPPPLTELPW
jgi:hypothetical protein